MVSVAHSTLIMLRKPDIYSTLHTSPLRGTHCQSLPPQVSHKKSRPSSPLGTVVTSIYTPLPQAASLPSLLTTLLGRNLPPPCLGPALIRKWEQQPGTGVIPACHFPPLPFGKSILSKLPCPRFYKISGYYFLQCSQLQAGAGWGGIVTEEIRGKRS